MADPGPNREQEAIGLRILDEQTCWDRLASMPIARVAVVHRRRAHLVPVSHRVHGQGVAFVSVPGTKLDAICNRPDTPITLEVDDYDEANETGWSVVVTGTARPVTSLVERARLDRLQRPSWMRVQDPNWVDIEVEQITGRRV